MPPSALRQVISGGQLGVDRVALEVARDLGIATGGTVPYGCRTEHGTDRSLLDFGCVESPYYNYKARTVKNVYDSDATVVFGDKTSPGCFLTISACIMFSKLYVVNPTALELRAWLDHYHILILNVAGNRQSTNPAAAVQAREVLTLALK